MHDNYYGSFLPGPNLSGTKPAGSNEEAALPSPPLHSTELSDQSCPKLTKGSADIQFPGNSARYSRTTRQRRLGGDLDALRTRWVQLLEETLKLAGKTFGQVFAPAEEGIIISLAGLF